MNDVGIFVIHKMASKLGDVAIKKRNTILEHASSHVSPRKMGQFSVPCRPGALGMDPLT